MSYFPSYYKDYNYIGHHYYGWALPDAEYLEEKVKNISEKTQASWIRSGIKENMLTEHRLFKTLELARYPCDSSSFKLSKKPETIRKHDCTWEIVCNGCDNPDIYYIKT